MGTAVARLATLLWTLFLLSSSTFPAQDGITVGAQVVQRPLRDKTAPAIRQVSKQNDDTLNAYALTHTTWNELRAMEPTWKETNVKSNSESIYKSGWFYFKMVFRALFMNTPSLSSSSRPRSEAKAGLSEELQRAVTNLERAASSNEPDAMFLLAEMNFFGNFSHPRHYATAFDWYSTLAERDGNATAQHMLGLMYSTGIGGAVQINQAKAQIYHTYAAEQGEIRSEMTLAYRYQQGIGTAKNCGRAAEYYKRAADKAMTWWQSGPPGGHLLQKNSWRWVEEAGGAYGEGASVSSSGPMAGDKNAIYASFEDVLEYLDMKERQGDWQAVLTLGKHFYEPPRGYRRNLRKAQKQFMKIAREYWTKDGKVNSKTPKGIDKIAAKSAAYIGRMFLRGEGMEQNFEKAITWFRRGIANGDAFAQYHLGLMYRDGLGVPRDGSRAASYFKAAAEQNLAVAQSALGVMFLDQGEVETAGRYFEIAANAGLMEAFYYLAELQNQGIGRQKNCHLATAWYKIVVEKAETLHSSFVEANSAYERGDVDRAFVASIMAAEQGYESAQANVAYLLDQKTSILSLPAVPFFSNPLEAISTTQRTALLDNAELALIYFTRSANQQNIDSMIKAGDYHLAGIGANLNSLYNTIYQSVHSNPNVNQSGRQNDTLDRATHCYTTAAESHHSAQALWNLGWMHENGIGSVEQDFHMAKRYYDLALEYNSEAYLPVTLALFKLRARSWWNGISGGKVKPIGEDDDTRERERRPKTFIEWLNRFLDAAEEMDAQELAAHQQNAGAGGNHDGADDGLDGIAFGEPGMPGGDDNYWHGHRRDHEARGGVHDEEGYNAEEYYGDFDDGLTESLIIIALAGVLAMLVYARQQRQRAQQQGQQQQQAVAVAITTLPNRGAAPVVDGGGGGVAGERGGPAAPLPGAVPTPTPTSPVQQQQQQDQDQGHGQGQNQNGE